MDKQSAIKLIRETFEKSFDKEQFVYFIKNLFNKIEIETGTFKNGYYGQSIPESFKPYIKMYKRIGKYNEGNNRIDVLVVYLEKEKLIERARTMQRNFIGGYLNGKYGSDTVKDAALVAFISPNQEDWRFSLVKMEYKLTQTKTGRPKGEEEFTPAKRFSFLVGRNEPNHTAQSRLYPLLKDDINNPTLIQLEEAFNIEIVTKEFFEKYRDLFIRIKEAMDNIVNKDPAVKEDFTKKGVDTVNFAKKSMGQIVFLYFLQKKGWFGVEKGKDWGTGSKRFLRDLYEGKIIQYKNFFNDVLEPLFYDALARDRSDIDHYNEHFKTKIPFLNGGLFDPINNYDWVNTDILLSDELFSNRTEYDSEGTGILDVFDLYNFTVSEDEPLEKEVAIDPELLGKAYEKFNAIRPDNFEEYKKALRSGQKGAESKFNKQYGVYYTPREIVHYMCQQSLINYLVTELSSVIPTPYLIRGRNLKEDIEILIKYGEMAVEHDIVYLEKKEKNAEYKGRYGKPKLPKDIEQNANLIDEKLASIRVCDPAVGSGAFPVGMMTEIVKTRNVLSPFIGNQNRTIYNYKRDCIQNSLYGVDIDPGAVEIAKLRLWLSLVVDEESIKQIKPLPNLDYKIVCGNSLLGVEKNVLNWQLFDQLEKLKPLLFNETNASKKKEYKRQIDELIREITNNEEHFDFEVYFSEVFHEKKGFDVVIANPPYDVYQGNRKNEIEVIKKYPIYDKSSGGKLNSYKLFLAKSIELQKPQGLLCEIFQNSFLADRSATKIRKYFIENQRILRIDSFPERDDTKRRVFEDVKMSVCILFNKNTKDNEYSFQLNIWKDKFMDFSKSIILNNFDVLNFDLENSTIPSINQNEIEILKKVSHHKRLKRFAKCYEGEINLTFHKEYLKKEKTGNSKMIKGAAVQKWLIKEKMSQGEIEYLDHTSYLKEKQGKKSQHFKVKRIVMQGITGVDEKYRLKMTIIEPKIFCGNSVNYILIKDNNITYKYLLALLNSHLMNWYFKVFSTNSNVNGYEVDEFPVLKISSDNQKPFIDLVDKILAITKDDDYLENAAKQVKAREYEKQIDKLVYKLYGLALEEIKIVENYGTK